jgi:hypothetical protein
MSGAPFVQNNFVQVNAWQAGYQLTAAAYSLGSPSFARPTFVKVLSATSYSLGPLSIDKPVFHKVTLLHANSYAPAALSFGTAIAHQNHQLVGKPFSLSISYSTTAAISQKHRFTAPNQFWTGSPVFDKPHTTIVNPLTAGAFYLGSPTQGIAPRVRIIGNRLRVSDYFIAPSFGYPRLTQTQVLAGMPPLFLTQIEEAAILLDTFLAYLLAAVPMNTTGAPNIGLGQSIPIDKNTVRRLVGDMRANATDLIRDATLAQPLQDVFTAAYLAHADFDLVDIGLDWLLQQRPASTWARAVMSGCLLMSMSLEAKLITNMTFVSREDVAVLINRVKINYEAAKELGIDDLDQATYQNLNSLGGALVNHLALTELQLPRFVDYEVNDIMPSLTLANLIYGDASKADEISDENKVIHPAFCPISLRVLSR